MLLRRNLSLLCAVVALTGVVVEAGPAEQKPGTQASDHREWARRVPFRATLETTGGMVQDGQPGYDADCAGAPMASIVGVGASDLLGVLWLRQTHCLGVPDKSTDPATIPFSNGKFELIDARGKTVKGQYRGRLVATFNVMFDELGPMPGHWLIQGQACVSGGDRYARIVDDCAQGKYAPTRGFFDMTMGIFDLATGRAQVFLDQTIGVMGRD